MGIMQQQTEVVHQHLARRRPTVLNEISEKDDFRTLVNSECDSSGQKAAQRDTVQHTLTPTQCPDSDLKKAIREKQIFPEDKVIIKGRNLLDKCQQQRQPPRDSIESKTAIQLNMLAQPNPELGPQHLGRHYSQRSVAQPPHTHACPKEESASYQMNNLTLTNLTNVNPLLGGSSSNQNGLRLGTMQDYADESPSNILLTNQSSQQAPHQKTHHPVRRQKNTLQEISSPKLLQSRDTHNCTKTQFLGPTAQQSSSLS